MARLAEVGIAPAEPLGDAAAELTFELDEIFSMFGAIFHWNFAAIGTDKLCSVE
jgi:hypothetical protein